MLPRILEPEVMDSLEEALDYDAMDHSEVNRAFVEGFLSIWNGRSPILDVGTGTARISIELCQRSATACVTAIDLADHMLRLGRKNVVEARLEQRIYLRHMDAKALPFANDTFAAVISNSIIHHIPAPAVVLSEMVRVLAPEGILFVRDLLRPDSEADIHYLVAAHAADANLHQRQMFADSLRAALTLTEIRELVHHLGFDPMTVQQTSDRHWTWSLSLAQ